MQANQSVITDLSKLGKPGDHFVHDFFLPGTQLTFPQSTAAQIAKVAGVASVSSGLVLAAVHQEGTVPKIVAKIKTGGDQIQVNRRLTPPTPAEFQKMQACLQKQGITVGGAQRPGRERAERPERARRRPEPARRAASAPAAVTETRSRSACPRGCSASAPRSRRRSRRCSR